MDRLSTHRLVSHPTRETYYKTRAEGNGRRALDGGGAGSQEWLHVQDSNQPHVLSSNGNKK